MNVNHSSPSILLRAWRYYRREGLRLFFKKVVLVLRRWHPFKREQPSPFQQGLLESNPGAIFGHIDTPAEGRTVPSGILTISGWACSRAGIQSIDLSVGKQPVNQVRTSLPRSDVKQHYPKLPDAHQSGFSADVRVDTLQYGTHQILLTIHDNAGNTRIFSRTFQRVENTRMYHAYYSSTLLSKRDLRKIKRQIAAAPSLPEIELWIGAPEGNDLASTIRSIRAQDYPAWRCLIVAGGASRSWLQDVIDIVAGDRHTERFQILDHAPTQVDEASGTNRYYGFLRAGETLAPHALYLYALYGSSPDVDVIYSDHDLVQPGALHVQPHFKPDWSPEYLLSRNYIGGFFLGRDTAALRKLFHEGLDTGKRAWRFDLLLRLTDTADKVVHIPKLLWSAPVPHKAPDAEYEEERFAVEQALKRRGMEAAVLPGELLGTRRIKWPISGNPQVSVIIPTTGRMDHLRPCVESITAKTAYKNYELIFIDNGRGKHPEGIAYLRSLGLTVVERDEPFNWAKLNNDGVHVSNGDLLLFLNDDVEVIDEDWLTELVCMAVRPDVGAVGSLLLYPDGSIQHAGVFLVGHGGGAIHFFRGLDPKKEIYLDLHRLRREVSANTGACLMVHRARFEAVGGFDENLAIVGNDVDLCLRLAEQGYRNIWTPYSRLIHHESVSRKDINIQRDEKKIQEQWADLLRNGDPYYNPNLAQTRSDCSIDWDKVKHVKESLPEEETGEGINLIGYIRAEMGVGQATRGEACAMYRAGVPFTILDYSYGNPSRMRDTRWLHQTTNRPVYAINLLHVNADLTPQAFSVLPKEFFDNRYNIGFWAWELPEFPDEWLSSFALVDEVWVPSAFVQEAVSRKSPVPVLRIPHAVEIPTGPFLARDYFKLPKAAYQFLMMYDVNSIQERKNPKGAICAFVKSFEADDASVSLVIKINNADEEERRRIAGLTEGYRNIHIIDRTLDRHEVDSLHACSDCFLSLHRSEGFGLTLAEAMSLKKPVIATYWSGNVDFMNRRNAACIDYELVPLEQDYGPYKAGQYWAEPDLEQAAWWMKRLREDPARGQKLGAAAKDTIASTLSPISVGKKIRDRVQYIRLNNSLDR